MRASLIVVAILAHGVANAQAPASGETPLRMGPGIRPPAVISMVDPEYSDEAYTAKREGTVVLSLVVQKDGTATDVRAVRSLGLGLDEKAVAAVKNWRFRPADKDGMAVPVFATVEVNFTLRFWRVRPSCTRPTGETVRPTRVEDPQLVEIRQPAFVTLSYEVDEQGIPRNIRVDESSDTELNAPAVGAASKWRFAPITQGNQPVSFSCTTRLEHR